MEIWKNIDGYDNYQVSNLGNIKSLNYNHTGKEQILKPLKNKKGYLQVFLYKNGKGKNHYIHRLVYETFNGPIPDGMQINHLSEIKTENNLENLSLMSPKENMNFGTCIERSAKARTNGKTQSKPVIQLDFDGNVINEYPSAIEVERQTGYNCSNISKCCNGLRKQAYGYKWKYKKTG